MTNYPTSTSNQFPQDRQVWDGLKSAIAASSGFQRWQIEREVDSPSPDSTPSLKEFSLDNRVRRYLRETLETLAY